MLRLDRVVGMKRSKISEISIKVATTTILLTIAGAFQAPMCAQQNADLPPVSPQPSGPTPLSPSQPQQSKAPSPFNFQNFNSAPQNVPMQPPQPIPPTSTDPFVRGKILIRQATDMISVGQLDSAIGLLQKSLEYRKVDPTPQFLLGLIYDQKGAIYKRL